MKTKRSKWMAAAVLALGLAAPGARADHHDEKDKAHQEEHAKIDAKEFLKGALDASQLELRAAKMAQERSRDPEVAQLAATMTRDHKEISQQLKQLAEKSGISTSSDLSEEHAKQWQWLQSQKPGEEFDKAFLTHVIRDHTKDLVILESMSGQLSQDPELKTFVDKHIPVVKKHLEIARNAASEMGINAGAIMAAAGAPPALVEGFGEEPAEGEDEKEIEFEDKHGGYEHEDDE